MAPWTDMMLHSYVFDMSKIGFLCSKQQYPSMGFFFFNNNNSTPGSTSHIATARISLDTFDFCKISQ